MQMHTGTVCIPNINTAERRKRLASGVIMLGITLVVLIIMLSFGLSIWWRLLLFPLFSAATSGYFQWRDKT
jgi:hypothetical protein